MPTDPRAALTVLVAAFERHLEAAAHRRGENDPNVLAAYRTLADAFEDYDDALLDAFDEVTPLEVFHGDEDDEYAEEGDDEGDDEGDELDLRDDGTGSYTGMDDEEYEDASDAQAPSAPGPTRL